MASPPAFLTPSTTFGPFSSSTSVTTTEAPSSASNSAIARPMPDAPPVTSATLPATCPAIFASVLLVLPDHRRPLIRHSDIEHAQLHALASLPAIDRERSRHMQVLAAMGDKRIAELLSDRPKRDTVDDRAIARFKSHAQMRLPHFVGIDQLVRGKRKNRFGIAAAEWPRAVERRGELRRHATRADGAIDKDFVDVAR